MKILFISHETTRTGAPMVLLYFLRWISKHKADINVSVLSLKEGGLNDDFVAVCDNFYNYEVLVKPDELSFAQRLLVKLRLKKIRNKTTSLIQKLADEKFDVLYSNTIKSVRIGNIIKAYLQELKHIVHIHELNVIIRQLLPDFKDYINDIDHIIAPSDLVKQNLTNYWKVSDNLITRVYECSETNLTSTKLKKDKSVLHIGGSGTVHWRKGYDMFIQVARYIKTNYPEKRVRYTWVGKMFKLEQLIIEEDLRKLDLHNVVTFLGEVDNPSTVYNTFDVFLMTSREDPFPLVCIEVGMLGKPIISFENATGTNEIISKGGGYIIPYLDIEAMAKKIIYYIENPDKRLEHGDINALEFSNFSPEKICPQLLSIIEDQMK